MFVFEVDELLTVEVREVSVVVSRYFEEWSRETRSSTYVSDCIELEFSSVRERNHYEVSDLFLSVVVSEKSFVNAHVSCVTTEVFETVSDDFFLVATFYDSDSFFLGKTIFELFVRENAFFEDNREFAFEDELYQCVGVRTEMVVLF